MLTRTNSLLLAPHVALHGAGVPIASVLRRDVLQRVGLRAALRVAARRHRPGSIASADLTEIRRRPSRGFPNWVDKWLNRCRSGHEVAKAAERIDDARVADKLLDLAADIDRLGDLARDATTREILQAIRDDIGLGGAMELLDGRPGAEGSSHLDDLDALLQVADLQPDPERFETWLRQALDGPRASGGDPTADAARGVTLSTVHRVKGREWPHVVVFGADAGIFPHRLTEDVEEERRVFHVAITRGIEAVTVLADDDRPSPFLGELDGSAPKQAPRRPGPRTAAAPAGRGAAGTTRGGKAAAAKSTGPDLEGEDLVVFEELRRWRAEVAKRQGGPAFIIFGDAPLKDIATARPADLRALSRIKGVGPSKLDSYGDDVLEIVARFAVDQTAPELPPHGLGTACDGKGPRMLWFLLVVLFFGIVFGAIARLLVPGPDPMGIVGTWALGVAGSFVGGFLGYVLFGRDFDDGAVQMSGVFGSIIGAVVLLLLVRTFRGGRRSHA